MTVEVDLNTIISIVGVVVSIISIALYLNFKRIKLYFQNPRVFITSIQVDITFRNKINDRIKEDILRKMGGYYNGNERAYKVRIEGITYTIKFESYNEAVQTYVLSGVDSDMVDDIYDIPPVRMTLSGVFKDTYLQFKYRHLKKELRDIFSGLFHYLNNLGNIMGINIHPQDMQLSVIFEISSSNITLKHSVYDNGSLKIQVNRRSIRIDISDSNEVKNIPGIIKKSLIESVQFLTYF